MHTPAEPKRPVHRSSNSRRRPFRSIAFTLPFIATIVLSLHLHPAEAFGITMTCRYLASDGVRPDESCPPWRASVFGDTLLTRDFLVVSTASPKQSVSYRQYFSVLPDTIVIRFRMRLVSGVPRGSQRTAPAVVYFARGLQMGSLYVGVGEVFLGGPGITRQGHVSIATTDSMHTFGIESWGDSIRVSRDGRPLLRGNTYLVQAYGTSFGSAGIVGWGENDPMAYGVSEWEFIEHNLSGCETVDLRSASRPPLPAVRGEDITALRKRFIDPAWTLWKVPDAVPLTVFRDNFDGALDGGWRWVRENPATRGSTSTHLAIALERGDLFQDWTNNAKNILIRPVGPGDFVVTLGVEVYLAADINQVHILLYTDDDTYVRFGVINDFNGRVATSHTHELRGKTQRIFGVLADSTRISLRVLKKGQQAQLQYKLDDKRWILQDQIDDLGFVPTHVGLVAFDGSEPPSASFAFFDHFELREYNSEAQRAPVLENVDAPATSP